MSNSGENGEQSKDFMITTPYFDFNDPNTEHDTVLVVEGMKFYVTSGYISIWSEYFRGLLGSDFKEATSKEIEIEEVSAEDFKEFLNLIYPSQADVTEKNVVPLINMAYRFLAPGVMVACKKFISEKLDKIDILDLLEVSIVYNITDVKKRIGSLIFASPHGITASRRCNECKYCTRDAEYCGHNDEGKIKITINWFIHSNKDRICQASNEVKSFIIKASVGDYQ